MRKIIIFAIINLLWSGMYGQESGEIQTDNYVTEIFQGIYVKMPDYREIRGGTKLVITYDEECPEELRGAFDYAAKIWEEALPTAPPISLTVGMMHSRKKGLASSATYKTYEFNGERVNTVKAPASMIKSVLLQEYHKGQQHRFFDEINESNINEILNNDSDIRILYNSDMIDSFSFSLDGDVDADKYDFVTLAMRDIALGLGFGTNFTADIKTKEILNFNSKVSPFEKIIKDVLNTTDPKIAYVSS